MRPDLFQEAKVLQKFGFFSDLVGDKGFGDWRIQGHKCNYSIFHSSTLILVFYQLIRRRALLINPQDPFYILSAYLRACLY